MRTLSGLVIAIWSVAFALLILDLAVSTYNIDGLIANDRAVERSRDISRTLADLLSDIKDAETGQRGYQITGLDEYLAPYREAEVTIPGRLSRLREITAADEFYTDRLDRVSDVVDAKFTELRRVIDLRKIDREAAQTEIAKGLGKTLMDAIRMRVREMEQHEESILAARSAAARSRYSSTRFTNIFGGALTILMVAMAFAVIRREFARRVRAEEEALASEARFRTLTDAIPQLIWNANVAGRITYFNRRWMQYTGLTTTAAHESWWSQVAHPDDAARLEAGWRAAIAERPEPFELEVRIRDVEDGSYHWFATAIVPLHRPDGSVDQWIGSLSSIDDQKRHSEILASLVKMRTAELESSNHLLRDEIAERTRAEARAQAAVIELGRSNEELEKFAYVASHDLQEPLRKIQSFGDRLVKKYSEPLGADGREYVDRMHAAATRMRTLIDDLLTFSRVTSKGQPFASIELGAIVRDVLSDLEHRLAQSGGTVTVGDLPALEADPLQMRQLFQNLIGNALKFQKPDVPPLVAVQATAWEALPSDADPARPTGQGYRITVSDNGIGFDPQYAERIFELFQRLHGRGEYDGTGIGLAICRKILQRHGGTIIARSQLGVGTTFVIDLPIVGGQ